MSYERELHLTVADAELIASAVVKLVYPVMDDISTNEAYKAYGRKWVQKAVKDFTIRPAYVGNKAVFSRTELNALRAIERRQAELVRKNNKTNKDN